MHQILFIIFSHELLKILFHVVILKVISISLLLPFFSPRKYIPEDSCSRKYFYWLYWEYFEKKCRIRSWNSILKSHEHTFHSNHESRLIEYFTLVELVERQIIESVFVQASPIYSFKCSLIKWSLQVFELFGNWNPQ